VRILARAGTQILFIRSSYCGVRLLGVIAAGLTENLKINYGSSLSKLKKQGNLA